MGCCCRFRVGGRVFIYPGRRIDSRGILAHFRRFRVLPAAARPRKSKKPRPDPARAKRKPAHAGPVLLLCDCKAARRCVFRVSARKLGILFFECRCIKTGGRDFFPCNFVVGAGDRIHAGRAHVVFDRVLYRFNFGGDFIGHAAQLAQLVTRAESSKVLIIYLLLFQ